MAEVVDVICRYCGGAREVPRYYAGRYTTCGSAECTAKRVADRAAAAKAANTGRAATAERRAKASAATKGKAHSEAHTAAATKARKAKGWFRDPEIGQKISEGRARGKKPDVVGPNNPMWKGGVAKSNQYGRGTSAYADWRDAVLSKAGRRCERCGRSGHVVAHHRWSWAGHPERRYDVENGEALCRSCHATEHGHAAHFNQTTQPPGDKRGGDPA